MIERGARAASREDPDVSAAIRSILEAEGVTFMFGTTVEAVAKAGHGVLLSLKSGDRLASIEGSHLLVALGRTPNTADLNLGAAGIETDTRGYIPVDDHLRTKVKGIWAMGDVNGRGAFTHTSYNDFEIVADNVIDGGKRSIAGRIPVYGLFIDPPLGRAGMSEAEVRKSGRKALMGVMPMARVARARERGETQGLIKVLVDAEQAGAGRRDTGYWRRRDRPFAAATDGGWYALYNHDAHGAYPPDGDRTDPDAAGGFEAFGVRRSLERGYPFLTSPDMGGTDRGWAL